MNEYIEYDGALSAEEMDAMVAVAEAAEADEALARTIATAIVANPEQALAALKLGVARARVARGESIEGWY
jgi:hypothetical protein